MKLLVRRKTAPKVTARIKKKVKIRKRLEGVQERPRLVVYKSLSHIYAQIVQDDKAATLVASSSLKSNEKVSKKEQARLVGLDIGKKALAKQINQVVFDRSGYRYHGRVKALADGAREAGLKF